MTDFQQPPSWQAIHPRATLAIVGLGLMGGSCALAQRPYFNRIVAWDSTPSHLDWAQHNQLVDAVYPDLPCLLADAPSVVVLATPVNAVCQLFTELAAIQTTDPPLLMDLGSTKQTIAAAARALPPMQKARTVLAHPIAGAEFSGPHAAKRELFHRQKVVLTPLAETLGKSLTEASRFWERAGAEVFVLPATDHDAIFSAASHLPHFVAFALMNAIHRHPQRQKVLNFAGASLRDCTRIAASSPFMWRDIALTNREFLLQDLTVFQAELSKIIAAITDQDSEQITILLEQANAARSELMARNPR